MTISSFCHDQLRQHGPLALDVLARLAVDEGVTKSRTPESSVRSAIAYNAAELPDNRWASPVELLEGRWLTTRALRDSWPYERPVHTRHDLAPLHFALRATDIPLATGGVLRRQSYGDGWKAPKGWPNLECNEHQLLAFGPRDGVLHVKVIEDTSALRARGHALALAVGRLDQPPHWSYGVHAVTANLLSRIWELAAAGSAILTEPAPPLSECVPPLTSALDAERHARAEDALHWRPTLDLPAELEDIAIAGARDADNLLDEWLNAFVIRSLLALDTGTMWQPLYDDRVRPLRRRI